MFPIGNSEQLYSSNEEQETLELDFGLTVGSMLVLKTYTVANHVSERGRG